LKKYVSRKKLKFSVFKKFQKNDFFEISKKMKTSKYMLSKKIQFPKNIF